MSSKKNITMSDHVREGCLVNWKDGPMSKNLYITVESTRLYIYRTIYADFCIKRLIASPGAGILSLPEGLSSFMIRNNIKTRGANCVSGQDLLKILLEFDPEQGENFMFCCINL